MKLEKKRQAIILRTQGYAINTIATELGVAKSSVSTWVREVVLDEKQNAHLRNQPFTTQAVERRRLSRLKNEGSRRDLLISAARKEVTKLSLRELWLMGTMLYWAEGGKTQRMVRFSNGDPRMIIIMMQFFRLVCKVPESKFRGYIHIHPHLDHLKAERYWSSITRIPSGQFFKTYRIQNKSSQNTRDTLPNGVLDIYVLDVTIFYKITGWADGIFTSADTIPIEENMI
ncbi:MAG: hypothetical protein WAO28_01380 [Candidatus Microsaccharimonas sp.]